MKLTKQMLHEMIEETMRDCDSAQRCMDLRSLKHRPMPPRAPDGSQPELIELARCHGKKGRELPSEFNDGNGPIYAAWVEGYIEHIRWMDKCAPGWDKK